MRLTRLLGAALGTGFLFLAFSTGANAYDHYDRERDRDHYRHDRWRYEHRTTITPSARSWCASVR